MTSMKEFAEKRGVNPQSVSIYLKRHGVVYKKSEGLSDEALKILEQKYPLQKPVEVVNADPELYKKLINAQEVIINLQAKLNRLEKIEGLYEADRGLIEDQKRQMEEKDESILTLKNELDSFEKTVFGFYRKKKT